MAQLDKAEVKAGLKNTKKVRKQMRKNAHRNSYAASARFAVSAAAFAWLLVSGLLEARDLGTSPEPALVTATIAFFVLWIALGFVERPISRAIATHMLETRRAEREAAEQKRKEAEAAAREAAIIARERREAEEAARRAERDLA
jgi:hypothetical protein